MTKSVPSRVEIQDGMLEKRQYYHLETLSKTMRGVQNICLWVMYQEGQIFLAGSGEGTHIGIRTLLALTWTG